ncbi:MAG TPA: NlpC/P60 family protein [Candidatus Limnocylindrales bacterium]|jgi:hypothetical protein|nr:NlpC/P60 family protein [Candidatus Limnocylindrales bacterium]
MRRRIAHCTLIVSAILFWTASATAQCRPGLVLVGEDAHYWYCSAPLAASDVHEVLDKNNPEMLGSQWRFRKGILDAVAGLARDGRVYQWGGKILVQANGTSTWICVADECRNSTANGIDCSGAAAYGELSSCFIGGFYAAAGTIRGLETSAAGQADIFKRYKAFRGRSDTPLPGDLIFFKNTARKRSGITHVAIYVGTTRDGRTVILHASSRAGVVLFGDLSRDLASNIAGYGDSSRLFTAAGKQ